jgi:hypothetical protein
MQRHFGLHASLWWDIGIVGATWGERILRKKFLKGKIFFSREFAPAILRERILGVNFFFTREFRSRNFAGGGVLENKNFG